jgi:hypothetical protein
MPSSYVASEQQGEVSTVAIPDAVNYQMVFNRIISLFSAIQVIGSVIILLPNTVGVVGGLFLGLSGYIMDTKVNDLSVLVSKPETDDSNPLSLKPKTKVSLAEKIFLIICACCDYVSNVISTYVIYVVYGVKLAGSNITFCILGAIIGMVSAAGNLFMSKELFTRHWRSQSETATEDSSKFSSSRHTTAFFKLASVIDNALQIGLSYVIMIPGPIGLILGISMAISAFFINVIVSIQIIYYDDDNSKTNEDSVPKLKSTFFIMLSTLSIMLCSVNAFVSSYNGIFLLGATLFTTLAPGYLVAAGIIMGIINLSSTALFMGTISYRYWNDAVRTPESMLDDAGNRKLISALALPTREKPQLNIYLTRTNAEDKAITGTYPPVLSMVKVAP